MRFSILSLFLLPLLTLFTASTSFAETNLCPTLQRSKQGAWLLIIDSNFRVRIEQRGETVDLGIKVEDLGEDFKRTEVSATSPVALSLTAKVTQGDNKNKVLQVVYAQDLTTIFHGENIISVNNEGNVTCSQGDREAAELYLDLLEIEGFRVQSHKVETASRAALAAALGL